jgi:hypothetical protein
MSFVPRIAALFQSSVTPSGFWADQAEDETGKELHNSIFVLRFTTTIDML